MSPQTNLRKLPVVGWFEERKDREFEASCNPRIPNSFSPYNLKMQYRRIVIPGSTYFFTVVTFQRRHIFSDANAVEMLRASFRHVLQNHSIQIEASVILPDHLHMIWRLPDEDGDYPTRWRLIKSYFSHHYAKDKIITGPNSRMQKGELPIWQRRYWEHQIRDEEDLHRHIEYIHYNPVKHELAISPIQWEYSSFRRFVEKGFYPKDWGTNEYLPNMNNDIGHE